ncbi:MAG: peptide deformylase [Candidatus Margulisiibacteriota bacterium]|nr:peptide deformylase [Candidatus Margulisiibacteriota bacterium]
MSILDILRYPNPVLRKKCKAVKKVDDSICRLIKDMIDTMHEAPGVGLAAPQVGKNIRLIVVDIGEGAFAVVNPKIKKKSGKQMFEEGCLCLPGLIGPVERSSYVLVTGLDRNGEPLTIEAEGYLATVLQHEIDHLEGKLFIDRVKDNNAIRQVTPHDEEKEELI